MAEYCFYYIAGCDDLALSHVTIDDTSENVKRILSEVSYILNILCIVVNNYLTVSAD